MSRALITEDYLTDIADAIRAKNGSSDTYTPPQMAAAITNIPNAYTAGDEGKVVSNGELVAQTAHATVTENGTIDTTLNNSVTVNVSGGGGGGNNAFLFGVGDYYTTAAGDTLTTKSITVNGMVGKLAVIIVMRRSSITVDNGATLLYTSSQGWQFISVYTKIMTAASETFTITASASGRMCICSYLLDGDATISSTPTIQQPDNTSGQHIYTISPSSKVRLFVLSQGYAGSGSCILQGASVVLPLGISNFRYDGAGSSLGYVRMAAGIIMDVNTIQCIDQNSLNGTDDYNNSFVYLFDIN